MSNAEYLEKYGIDTSTSPGDSFNRALSDFTHDVASGGAIRHLCDKGYTVSQIMKMLDYPTPRERVEKTFTRHLSESGTLLSELPDGYESIALDKTSYLLDKGGEQTENTLILCEFGRVKLKSVADYEKLLLLLDADEAEYIKGIRWTGKPMYHKLTPRMRGIAKRLAESGSYEVKLYGKQM